MSFTTASDLTLYKVDGEEIQKSTAVSLPYAAAMYRRMCDCVMSYVGGSMCWSKHPEVKENSFVEYAQLFMEKTATILKSTALVTFSKHVVVLDFSDSFQRELIENGTLQSYCYMFGKNSVDWIRREWTEWTICEVLLC